MPFGCAGKCDPTRAAERLARSQSHSGNCEVPEASVRPRSAAASRSAGHSGQGLLFRIPPIKDSGVAAIEIVIDESILVRRSTTPDVAGQLLVPAWFQCAPLTVVSQRLSIRVYSVKLVDDRLGSLSLVRSSVGSSRALAVFALVHSGQSSCFSRILATSANSNR